MLPYDQSLNDDELEELEDFLASPSIAETSLDLFGLEGFFVAILLAPKLIMPSLWLDWVWDFREGEAEPEFASFEDAQRKIGLVMSFYNMVASHLAVDPEVYEPRLAQERAEEASSWRHGFFVGMRFDVDSWAELAESKQAWLDPILTLGTSARGPGAAEGERIVWTPEIGRNVAAIHDFWRSRRRQRPAGQTSDTFAFGRERESPSSRRSSPFGPRPVAVVKVGRNELCPCGSGKKYKRCCGRS